MAIRKRHRSTGRILDDEEKTNKARARVISSKGIDYSQGYLELLQKSQHSNQLADPFDSSDYLGGTWTDPVEPIFPFKELVTIYTESTILRQCVEAYVVNIESYGYVLEYIGPDKQRNTKAAQDEYKKIESLIASLSYEDDIYNLREKSRVDYEVLGSKAFEVGRDTEGRITMLAHIPMCTIRLTRKDPEPVEVDVKTVDSAGNPIVVSAIRYFRRFVQKVPLTNKKIYFKEFGDPRIIDPQTGLENPSLSPDEAATELLFDAQYVPGHVYGLPRWLGQLPAILGSKEAEFVNLNFFRDNAIPAMAVLVSGGFLTEDSFQKLENYVTAVKGQKSMNRITVIESLADTESGGSLEHPPQAPKLDIKPMISERQQDGLFQDYDEKNAGKVRSAFRLPPIFIGRAEDYTRASAFASMQTAENQIFVPERLRFDMIINNKVLATHGIKYWYFKSIGAPLSDPDSMARIVRSLGTQGALTANTVIKVANQILNVQIESITEDWGDVPFSVIEGYIRQGYTIKGLDSFVKIVEQQLPKQPPGNENANPDKGGKPDPATKVKESFVAGVHDMVDRLQDADKERLQTSAKVRKANIRRRKLVG